MSAPAPDAPAVVAQLDRILASPVFANAGRLSRFLRFVVERTLAGDGEQLKEYLLGTEVFDRAGDYDPRLDSIVRVEARRLRSKLAESYEGPGTADPVVIRVDKGSYVATFETAEPASPAAWAPAAEAAGMPGPAARPASMWRRHGWSAAIVGAAVVAIALLVWRDVARGREGSTVHASSRVSVAILPLVRYDTAPKRGSDALADAVTDGLIGELARQPGIEVASRTTVMQYRDIHASLSAIGADPRRPGHRRGPGLAHRRAAVDRGPHRRRAAGSQGVGGGLRRRDLGRARPRAPRGRRDGCSPDVAIRPRRGTAVGASGAETHPGRP